MKFSDDLLKYLTLAVLAAGLGTFVWQLQAPSGTSKGPTVDVKVPALSMLAIDGVTAFDANCATCHGLNAAGTDKGPPLVHDIYNPGHLSLIHI